MVDYGVGNLRSIKRSLEFVGASVKVTSNPSDILAAKKLLLPGVGAFPKAISALKQKNLHTAIKEFAHKNKSILAICLGLQLLMDEGEEFEVTKGLGLIPGRVIPIPVYTHSGFPLKVPFVGWSKIQAANEETDWSNGVLKGVKTGSYVYFAHSFMAKLLDERLKIAVTHYGENEITSVIQYKGIVACQFHPEKSGDVGLSILKNFLEQ